MAKVVEDRTMDIVGGVAAACAQAKAWLRVTGHGMHGEFANGCVRAAPHAPTFLDGSTHTSQLTSLPPAARPMPFSLPRTACGTATPLVNRSTHVVLLSIVFFG